jgi:adenylate kinase
MQRPTIIIMGSAGSGKGTQSELLEEQLGYHIVEAGAIFRAKSKEDSELGRKVKEIHDTGKHASDELITELMADHMKDLTSGEALLIDGYPRTLGQAERLPGLLRDSGFDPDKYVAVWIQVDRKEAERRLLNRSQCTVCKTVFMNRDLKRCPHCNGEVKPRDYDKPEAITHRLDFFEKETMPAIKKYEEEGRLITVNGEQEVAHVFSEIKEKLKPFMEEKE